MHPTLSGTSPLESMTANALVTPKRIEMFGVVGAGLMASQIALLAANKLRVPIIISDLSADRVSETLKRMRENLNQQEAKGRLQRGGSAEIFELIRGTTDPAEFIACDAAIEAVFEELSVKRTVFRELEEYMTPDALLLTNTSSLSVASMAGGLKHPERVLGFHLFNPVSVLPLLELVRTPFTSDIALTAASDLAARLGKTAVTVADTPGFVVNRILSRMFSEVLAEIDEGGDPVTVDSSLAPWGLPMTPLSLIGYIGPSVQRHIGDTLHHAYPKRYGRSASLDAVVDAGLPGFFDEEGELALAGWVPPSEPRVVDQNRIRRRVRDALAEEAQLMLDEGVVTTHEDIDRCMTLGANFPPGGLTRVLVT